MNLPSEQNQNQNYYDPNSGLNLVNPHQSGFDPVNRINIDIAPDNTINPNPNQFQPYIIKKEEYDKLSHYQPQPIDPPISPHLPIFNAGYNAGDNPGYGADYYGEKPVPHPDNYTSVKYVPNEDNPIHKNVEYRAKDIKNMNEIEKFNCLLHKYTRVICFCLNIILLFILGAIIAAFSFSNQGEQLDTTPGIFTNIAQNINALPILDIVVTQSFLGCPQNYELLQIGTYPGTKKFCYCSLSGSMTTSTKCSSWGCSRYSSTPAENIYNWKNNSFCVKRSSGFISASICPTAYTKCFPGGCFPKSEGCPITNLTLSNQYNPGFNGSISVIKSINNSWLYAGKDGVSLPIIGISTSFFNIGCLDSNSWPAGKYYQMLNTPYSIGCTDSINDPALYTIDTDTQFSFYNSNSVVSPFTLPNFKTVASSSQIYMTGIHRYQLTLNDPCTNIDTTCFLSTSKSLTNFDIIFGIIFGIAYIINIVAVVVMILLFCAGKTKDFGQFVNNMYNDKSSCKVASWVMTVQTLLTTLALYLTYYYKSHLAGCDSYIQSIYQENCFQNPTLAIALDKYDFPIATIFSNIERIIIPYFIFSWLTLIHVSYSWKKAS